MTTEAQDAASRPLLQYAIDPATVAFGSTVIFTLTASNAGAGEIAFAPGDTIRLQMPVGPGATDLLVNSTVGTTSLSSGFVFAQPQAQPGTFAVAVLEATTIAPGAALQFQVSGAQINKTGTGGQQATAISLPVTESIGKARTGTSLVVTKTLPSLSVQCAADPQNVGLRQPTSVSWTATGATYVVLMPGNLRQDCTGLVSQGVFRNVIAEQVPVTTFQVTAHTDDQRSASATVNVETRRPTITFGPQGLPPIGYQDGVTLTWTTHYATGVYLTPSPYPPQVGPSGSLAVVPSTLATDPNAPTVVFALAADGYRGPGDKPARETVEVRLRPVEIMSFGFPRKPPEPSFPVAVVQNGLQQIAQIGVAPDIYRLTATGAGGPLVRHIGPGPWLAIEYFGGAPAAVAPGGTCALSWQTRNAASATLNGTPVTLTPSGDVQTGGITVSPAATTIYEFAVTDASGHAISNKTTIVVSSSTSAGTTDTARAEP
ncbi:hypothetical protein NS228_01930 [Methylobacterium indicum]|uniref:hypothetical protein n=1 Tax=Methylobacterium indicum TaxID=1775910 RepID=UPI0007348E74|nr:hypothetical protein [Methylobacterium indicum]KTS23839.1 hypothetical protein NS229_22275 [Methylobacterium indicum]KTS42575.1 hypothetical protein NS228_01930 [Methylobacterium indicum]KTS50297.1 hypothetical protein NS230_16345 [Methylobacterium indicum]